MAYSHLSIEELQRMDTSNTEAMAALGRRVLKMDFCLGDNRYCEHWNELVELQMALDNEPPMDCPHCGGLLDFK